MATLYMLVGLPGSGKSYYANTLCMISGNARIFSSDKIREELFNDENAQNDNELVFNTLNSRVVACLESGIDAIYDATNINYKRRRAFLNSLKKIPVTKTCIFMAVPFEKCLERNNNRARIVPEEVIKRMYLNFDVPMYCEGWDDVLIVGNTNYAIVNRMIELNKISHDNPHHEYSVGKHMIEAWKLCEKDLDSVDINEPYRNILSRAVLLHDIGKQFTKTFIDSRGDISDIAHYYKHENVGAYDSVFYTTDMTERQRIDVATLIRWHMYPFVIETSSNPNKTKEKAVRLLGKDMFDLVTKMNRYDRLAH